MSQTQNIQQMPLSDKLLKCCDCGQEFIFGIGEQHYFRSKQLSIPKRCLECRRKRRANLVPDQGERQGGEL